MFSKILNRIFDILFSLIFIILLSPIFLILSILIFLFDRGPIFADNNVRIGKDGILYKMYKFRSMIPNAHELIQTDPKYSDLKKKWIIQDKLSVNSDPRITPIGKFLRRTDLDEIAQFLNVLKGDMSIVGPRPWFVPELTRNLKKYSRFKTKMFKDILSVKPGITGLWQVSGRNRNTIRRRFELDLEYVRRKSFRLDLKIILKTPFVILKQIIKGDEYEK